MHILLVEDERHVRQVFGRTLSSLGNEVAEADSFLAAASYLDEQTFDVIIVDINLPDATGWDVLRHKSQGPNADTPVVVMSAIHPSVTRVREFRPSSVLLKPFAIDTLYRAVEQAAATTRKVKSDE